MERQLRNAFFEVSTEWDIKPLIYLYMTMTAKILHNWRVAIEQFNQDCVVNYRHISWSAFMETNGDQNDCFLPLISTY